MKSVIDATPLFRPLDNLAVPPSGENAPLSGHQAGRMMADVIDVVGGIRTILEVLESEALEDAFRRDADESEVIRPLMNDFHRASLTRLAIASAALLTDRVERLRDQGQAVGSADTAAPAQQSEGRRAHGRTP